MFVFFKIIPESGIDQDVTFILSCITAAALTITWLGVQRHTEWTLLHYDARKTGTRQSLDTDKAIYGKFVFNTAFLIQMGHNN